MSYLFAIFGLFTLMGQLNTRHEWQARLFQAMGIVSVNQMVLGQLSVANSISSEYDF